MVSIFQKWTFWPQSGGLLKKNSNNRTFHITWGSIQEWGCIDADTVFIVAGKLYEASDGKKHIKCNNTVKKNVKKCP